MSKAKTARDMYTNGLPYYTYSYCITMSLIVIIVIFLCPTSLPQVVIILIVLARFRGKLKSSPSLLVDTKNDRPPDFSIFIYFNIMCCS